MSTENPSERPSPGAAQADRAPRALRIIGLVAVCIGVAALAAATFVLSYSGIHVLARQAGITPRLARGYPLVIDAMLVVVLAAVLSLRGAGLPSKLFAWVTLLAVLAAAAGADALHAAGRRLPARDAAVTAAVVPWVLVFLAFALLLAMLRYARLRRLAASRSQVVPHGEARAHWQPGAQRELGQPVPAPPACPPLDLPARQSGDGVSPAPLFDAGVASPDAGAGTEAGAGITAAGTTAAGTTAGITAAADDDGPLTGATDAAELMDAPDLDDADLHAAGAIGEGGTVTGTADEADGSRADGSSRAEGENGRSEATQPNAVPAPASAAGHDVYPTIQPVLTVPRQPGPASAADAEASLAAAEADEQDLAIDADLGPDDPSSDESAVDPADGDVPYPADGAEGGLPVSPGAGGDRAYTAGHDDQDSDPVSAEPPGDEESPDPDMPVFHRMWSSPTPPGGM